MGYYTEQIIHNARKITQLHNRVHETYKFRDKNEHKRKEWVKACEEFHSQYNALAFPGGFDGAYERILKGDPEAMEAAISFLECRPYFFRSGYMFKDILRKAKRAPLNSDQNERLNKVIEMYEEYKRSKHTYHETQQGPA